MAKKAILPRAEGLKEADLHLPMLSGATGLSVSFTGSSAQSSAIDSTFVVLWADQDCYVTSGTNPTATSSSFPLQASTLVGFGINAGEKIAALQISSAGTLRIGIPGSA